MRNLIVFDLDGTLAESKSPIDPEMAALLNALLAIVKVAIISGGAWPQFEQQVLSHLAGGNALRNLSLLPTCGTQFYRYDAAWTRLYSEEFSAAEKRKIITSLHAVIETAGCQADKTWGDVIEDRGSQITFSALGQHAPLGEKKNWDPQFTKRKRLQAMLCPLIPEFSVRLGGATSVDVTRQGIDKGYGIRKLRDVLTVDIADMLFIGDALFPGGNDYPAREAGTTAIEVKDPHETKRVIEAVIACLGAPA